MALKLISKGYTVTVLDSLSPQIHGDNPEKTSPLYQSIKDKVKFVKGCVTSREDFYKYISFLKFNHALIILKSDLSQDKRKERYDNLNDVKTPNIGNLYSIILKLNYWCFKNSLVIPYYLYKRFQ